MTLGLSEATGLGRLLLEHRFAVPNHQRDYSWTEDEVRELIDDVVAAVEQDSKVYFVGLMVFLGTDANNLIVLDGQQRLATAIIIFSAIRSWLNAYDQYQRDADDIQRDYIGRRELGGAEFKPKMTLNVANQQMFSDYVIHTRPLIDLEAAVARLKKRDKNRLMLEAAISTQRWVLEKAAKLGDNGEAAKYFFKFVNYLRENVAAVKLIVPNEELAYTIFETLNDRGLELSPLDLVKNHLFGRAASHSGARVKVMESRWAQMMQTLASVRADNFLKAFWTSRHGRIRTRNLFDVFKRQYTDAEAANDLSMDLLETSEQYAALESADDPVWAPYSERTRRTVRSLKIVGSQQTHPVLLSALAKFSPAEVERLLRLLEVGIVRYLLVVGGNTGRFETTCAILARRIYAEEVTTATAARAELTNVYPTDDEFRHAFETKEEENNQKAQYFLRQLEIEAQRVARGEMPGELEPGTLTVEHILPKNPGSEWETVLASDPSVADDCTHRLGNLCLLTEVNRRLGREPFDTKKQIYDRSQLLGTKEVAIHSGWGRREIESRQAKMARLAVATWRFQ
jgi:hypothetical protein